MVLGPKFILLVYYVYEKRRLVFKYVIYSFYYYYTIIFLFQSNVRVNFKMKRCQNGIFCKL